jgi:hypothetical protein
MLPVKINDQFPMISENEAAMASIYRWFNKNNFLGGNNFSPTKSSFRAKMNLSVGKGPDRNSTE